MTLTIVTAADQRFWQCANQFLRRADQLSGRRSSRWVVYDLGLASARPRLERRFPWAEFRDFDFSAHPAHVRRLGNYAWKALVVHTQLQQTAGDLLWLDSASWLKAPLPYVHSLVERQPVLTLAGQARVRDEVHPSVWAAVGAPPPIGDCRVRVSGVVGFRGDSALAQSIAAEWAALSLRADWVEPPPPAGPRHHFDQFALSLILYRHVVAGTLELADEAIDISAGRPARWIASRLKLRADQPEWFAPLIRAGGLGYKAIDQLGWRAKAFWANPVNGLHRWPKEYFQVRVKPPDGAARSIPAPRWSYYADPFLCRQGGRTWLFVEEFRYPEHQGRLMALELDPGLRIVARQELRLLGAPLGHRSYPFVFERDGVWYLVPETSAHQAVDLFVSAEFPHRWRWHCRLLDGLYAADSTLLHHEGRWWLFTFASETRGQPASLRIFHSADLTGGRWIAHPMNAERRYAGAPFWTGRCGGPFVRSPEGPWLRPAHRSRRYYGEGIEFQQIDRLTPAEFAESPYRGAHPAAGLARERPLHHIAAADGWLAYDLRTRVSYGQHLPFARHWGLAPDPRVRLELSL